MKTLRLGIWLHLLLAAAVGIALAFAVMWMGVQVTLDRYVRDEFGTEAVQVESVLQSYYAVLGLRAAEDIAREVVAKSGGQVILRSSGQVVLNVHRSSRAACAEGGMSSAFVLESPFGGPALQGQFCLPGTAGVAPELLRPLLLPAGVGFLGALAVSLLLSRRIVLGVTSTARAARRFAAGDLRARVEPTGPREIADLGLEFNRMAQHLAEAQEQRQALVADVAHELRTPLTVLRGYVEALHDGVSAPEPALLEVIHTQAVQLQRLVDDLQELAQTESSTGLALDLHRLQLAEALTTAAASFSLSAQEKGVEIVVEAPEDLPAARADERRIAQVLHNLIGNALRYTPRGGSITLHALAADGQVRTEVRDTGVGIAPEHRARVFDRFYRVDPSRARETGGSGLGLTIAQGIVQAHGGAIGVEPNPGGGSVFWFTLPVWNQDGPA